MHIGNIVKKKKINNAIHWAMGWFPIGLIIVGVQLMIACCTSSDYYLLLLMLLAHADQCVPDTCMSGPKHAVDRMQWSKPFPPDTCTGAVQCPHPAAVLLTDKALTEVAFISVN
jgi:hypothetical protein